MFNYYKYLNKTHQNFQYVVQDETLIIILSDILLVQDETLIIILSDILLCESVCLPVFLYVLRERKRGRKIMRMRMRMWERKKQKYTERQRSLQWRHNLRDSVSNHQPRYCLLNRLFKLRSKKTSKLRVTGLCVGIHRSSVNSPHKWPVTRKCFHLMTSSCINLVQCQLKGY